MPPFATLLMAVLLGATLLGSAAVVGRVHRPDSRVREIARDRFVLGVPWGSLLVIALVLAVYLFVQDGITSFHDPVTIPYRAYSYFYPLGMLLASFSHASSGHLIGNLAGAAVVAPIAEYAWGHYPEDDADTDADARTSADAHTNASKHDRSLRTRLRTDPWLRALVVFPLAVVAITIVTSLFALGPVIGFSGVVFAFAAFALVHYPIVTIVGILGVQGLLLTLYRAVANPIAVYVAEPSPASAPSWAGIAIQGHALGFFIGLLLGIALLWKRGHRPDPLRLWIAILLFGISRGLWQIYWFGPDNTYFLFQGPGVLIVLVLALVVTVAVTGTNRPLIPRGLDRRLATLGRSSEPDSGSDAADRPLELARSSGSETNANATSNAGSSPNSSRDTTSRSRSSQDADAPATDAPVDRLERVRELAAGPVPSTRLSNYGRRQAAFVAIIAVFAVLAGMAIPVNLFVLEDAGDTGSEPVEIEDYTVWYAEDVENELTSPVEVGPLADAVAIESSGVIVASEQRQLWSEVVPAHRLAFTGEEEIVVGGPGWRETVHVERAGWEPVGNDTVYQIEIWAAGDEPRLTHESDASRADVRLNDRNVTVASDDGTFVLEVEAIDTGETDRTPIPEDGESATAGGLTFEREGDTVYATAEGTQVAVAHEESYE